MLAPLCVSLLELCQEPVPCPGAPSTLMVPSGWARVARRQTRWEYKRHKINQGQGRRWGGFVLTHTHMGGPPRKVRLAPDRRRARPFALNGSARRCACSRTEVGKVSLLGCAQSGVGLAEQVTPGAGS